jgi:two-component system, LytTR family, response regulator
MIPLRAVVVDDEPIARQALCRMLGEFPEVQVCGQADSVDQAEATIRDVRAHVVYLDIKLFGESGFDLVPRLDEQVAVVFVTAFDRYAIRAFEVNALDYLLKPVIQERLAETIRRLVDRSSPPLPSPGPEQLNMNDVILVQDSQRRYLLPLKRVCVIEVDGDFTALRSVDGQSGNIWRRLGEWVKILPDGPFVRIHRKRIVNLNHVEGFETAPGDRLRLHLAGVPKPCHVSRRLTPNLRRRLQVQKSPTQP